MIHTCRIKPKDEESILKLCEILKSFWIECYSKILSKKQLNYILKFISPSIVKNEIIFDNKEYFFIKKNRKIVGIYQIKISENILELSNFYIYEKYRNKGFAKNILNKIKKTKNIDTIKIYISQDHINSIKIFEKLEFKKIKPMALYLGSDYFLFCYLMEYKI